ncbi:MAG: amidase [Actinobacteria bacterium]|nr:amidase [Actinomycetota bacterium]
MADTPWAGDACSLVEEFRAGRRTPIDEMKATLAAVEKSSLNAVSFIDYDHALRHAAMADVTKPFGGVPLGVKELDDVHGWPATRASMMFKDQVANTTSTNVARACNAGGAVRFGLTTASEFGGVNVTRTVLNGSTHNPWRIGRTPGGSSGGSAAGVAGGLFTLATGGDGGGSIRIPAGFTGLVGLKSTYGRIPRGPGSPFGNLTVTVGALTRSVRDTARWFDVCNGFDSRDPLSLPRVDGWESALGTVPVRGLRVAIVRNWGGAIVSPEMWQRLEETAERLVAWAQLTRVDAINTSLPRMGAAWSISGMISIASALGDAWPACANELTPEIRFGVETTNGKYSADARAKIEERRVALNNRMAEIFDEVDLIITASNPDVAFDADGPLPDTFGGITAGAGNNGLLTFPANLYGNPGISVPAGDVDGLPIGLQIIGRHHSEQVLLELAHIIEREQPWPLIAPSSPL